MRTTLEIEDSVLEAVKELSRRQGSTIGQTVTDLLRRVLTEPTAPAVSSARHGFRPFPATEGTQPVSNEQLDRLRDTLGH